MVNSLIDQTNQDDVLIWPFSPNGEYTIQIAYKFLQNLYQASEPSLSTATNLQPLWKKIWSLKVLGKVKNPETPHPFETPGRPASVERPRALGRGKGPLTPPKPPLLVNDATYAVEQVMSIIKDEDIDDCDEYAPVAIRESGLHDLAKTMVRMKTLELRCGDYKD
nr:hypothetical protein CFP56_35635 [Quercus suber]